MLKRASFNSSCNELLPPQAGDGSGLCDSCFFACFCLLGGCRGAGLGPKRPYQSVEGCVRTLCCVIQTL